MTKENTSHFMVLPFELKQNIFNYIELKNSENIRLVCRDWQTIYDGMQHELLIDKIVSLFNELRDLSMRYPGCIDEARNCNISNDEMKSILVTSGVNLKKTYSCFNYFSRFLDINPYMSRFYFQFIRKLFTNPSFVIKYVFNHIFDSGAFMLSSSVDKPRKTIIYKYRFKYRKLENDENVFYKVLSDSEFSAKLIFDNKNISLLFQCEVFWEWHSNVVMEKGSYDIETSYALEVFLSACAGGHVEYLTKGFKDFLINYHVVKCKGFVIAAMNDQFAVGKLILENTCTWNRQSILEYDDFAAFRGAAKLGHYNFLKKLIMRREFSLQYLDANKTSLGFRLFKYEYELFMSWFSGNILGGKLCENMIESNDFEAFLDSLDNGHYEIAKLLWDHASEEQKSKMKKLECFNIFEQKLGSFPTNETKLPPKL